MLTAIVSPSDATDGSVTWSTSDATVATVDSNGTVTGIGVGSATVTVTTVDGSYSASSEITVLFQEEMIVYPNPASDQVYIYIPNTEENSGSINKIGLFEISGKLLFEYVNLIPIDGGNIFDLNISKVSSGLYLIKVFYEDNSYSTKKLLIKN